MRVCACKWLIRGQYHNIMKILTDVIEFNPAQVIGYKKSLFPLSTI